MEDKLPPTGPEITQPMQPIDLPKELPEMPPVETDPLDTGETLEVGKATVLVSNVDGKPYVGGSSEQGYVTSEDTTALPIEFEELKTTLQNEVMSGKKSRDEAVEAVKAFALDHNLPADSIKLNF